MVAYALFHDEPSQLIGVQIAFGVLAVDRLRDVVSPTAMSAEPERQELRYRRLGDGYQRSEATIRRAEEVLARAVED